MTNKNESFVELFLQEPQELLAMFHELEDQNLSLIQNGQDMEENIDEIKSQANVSPAFWPIFDACLKMIIGGDT